jgi:proteasome lid subunit RPN8/RPN11
MKKNKKETNSLAEEPVSTNRNKEVGSKPIVLKSQVKSVTVLGQLIDEMTDISVKAIPKEVIGLLGGKETKSQEILVSKLLFVNNGNTVSVAFSEDDFAVFERVLGKNTYCVGWWHSHPGYGLFLSQTDISTHIYSFQIHNMSSIALVIEPTIINRNGRAAFKCYQVIGEQGKIPFTYKEIASYIQE